MADIEKVFDIKINYGESIEQIARYREELNRCRQVEKELDATSSDYQETLAALKIEEQQYTEKIRVLNKEIQNEVKQHTEESGSLKALRAELSNTTAQYDALSRAEREGAKGQELKAHINELTDEIKGAEYETDRFYRNVGNYPQAMGAVKKSFIETTMATGSLKAGLAAAGQGVAQFGKQLLALLANPIVAIIAAIALAVMAVVKAMGKSEETSNRMKQALAPLQAVLQLVEKALMAVVNVIVSFVEGSMKAVEWVMKLAESLPFVGDAMKDVNARMKENIEIEKEKQRIEKQSRENLVLDAETQNQVAKLRDKVAQKDKYNASERKRMLQEAVKLEQEQAERRKKAAEDNYNILLREAALAENDAEMNKKLAEAKAAVIQADTEYYNNTRRLQQQIASFDAEEERERQAAAREAAAKEKERREELKRAAEERKRQLEEAIKAEKDAIKSAQDALLRLIQDAYEKEYRTTETKYDRDIDALDENIRKQQELLKKATGERKKHIENTITALNMQLGYLEREEMIALDAITKKANEDAIKKEAERIAKERELEGKSIKARLELIAKGTYEEALLKQQNAENEYQKKVEEINKEIASEEWKNEQLLLAQEKYNKDAGTIWNEYYANQKKLSDAEKKMQLEKYDSISKGIGEFSSALDALGEHNKAFAKMGKVLALGEIAVNTGKALAAGVASAQSVPFPANIAAIATTTATILGNIASAISTVKSAKFALGGLVDEEHRYATGGAVIGYGSGTSDSIPARLSNGESVMTATATSLFSPLLSSLNQIGGGVPINVAQSGSQAMGEDMLARAVARGVAAMPRPVVSVEEINKTQSRVDVLERISTI